MKENQPYSQSNSSSKITKNSTEVPKQIGPYKIESFLNKGRTSLIYLGIDPKNNTPIVVKTLAPQYINKKEFEKQFLNEIHILEMTNHPNIVKLIGYGQWENGYYIALEFIEGISLRQSLLRYPFPLKQALEIIIDLAYALCHLHAHQVIHRDLKPENILFSKAGILKLIDFGIAHFITEEFFENENYFLGTPVYMSPEQYHSPKDVSYPSDIYSLGIIAYELIIGKLSQGKIHLSLLPKGLQPIIAKTLQPEIKNRYKDIVDFINDIVNYMHTKSFNNDSLRNEQFSSILSGLKRSDEKFLPQPSLQLKNQLLAFSKHEGFNLNGVYYDFFENHTDSLIFIWIESIERGIESIISVAIIRGMIKSLIAQKTQSKDFLTQLNLLIQKDNLKNKFKFFYAVFDLDKQSFEYILSKDVFVWFVDKNQLIHPLNQNNIFLGDPFNTLFYIEKWLPKDSIILTSFTQFLPENGSYDLFLTDKIFLYLKENIDFSPQEITEGMIRKVRSISEQAFQENSIYSFCLRFSEN